MPASRRLNGLLSSLLLFSMSCGALSSNPTSTVRAAGTAGEASQGWTAEGIATSLNYLHTGLLPAEITHLARMIDRESRRVDLSPALVLAVIQIESSGYAFAKSHKDARGLMQLLPTTGAYVAGRIGVDWNGPDSLYDAGTNVRLGIAYLRQLVDRFGSVRTALAAYNWGPTRISDRLRRGKSVPAIYADRVLAAFGSMQGPQV